MTGEGHFPFNIYLTEVEMVIKRISKVLQLLEKLSLELKSLNN